MPPEKTQLEWSTEDLRAGERVAVAVSGGADSVALLHAMAESRAQTGIVLSAIHVHHGLRGAEADGDAAFVADLAARLEVPLRTVAGDAAALAAERGQGIEEASRALRYRAFRELLASRAVDTVATAHTLDDQAETVLLKLLRGAWTEGLGGIAPWLAMEAGGRVARPLLGVSRAQVVAYLRAKGQAWREDSSNRDPAFTRNRVRSTLLPLLKEFQPRIAEQLARMAAVARDEEAWWARELARVLPGMVLPGKPVRGGGRANSTLPEEAGVALELERLRGMHPALARRALRAAAAQLGAELSFEQTEALRRLAVATERATGKRGRVELGGRVAAERSARELRLGRVAARAPARLPELAVPVPGVLEAPAYGLRVSAEGSLPPNATLLLRAPRPGDRVRLRHGRGARSIKQVLERSGLSAAERALTPVLAVGSSIVWMYGVEVEEAPDFRVGVEPFRESQASTVPADAT